MGPPGGGRTFITNRFVRHFNIFAYTDLDMETIKQIFTTMSNFFLSNKVHSLHLFLYTPLHVSRPLWAFHHWTHLDCCGHVVWSLHQSKEWTPTYSDQVTLHLQPQRHQQGSVVAAILRGITHHFHFPRSFKEYVTPRLDISSRLRILLGSGTTRTWEYITIAWQRRKIVSIFEEFSVGTSHSSVFKQMKFSIWRGSSLVTSYKAGKARELTNK